MTTAPILKITNLHIRGLRGLQKLDLPQDGMGWDNGFPPVAVIGGANGSGKTTLLRCIADAALFLTAPQLGEPKDFFNAGECRIDFEMATDRVAPLALRFLVGDEAYVSAESLENYSFGYEFGHTARGRFAELAAANLGQALQARAFEFPRLVFFPSDGRDLVIDPVAPHVPRRDDEASFIVEWRREGRRDQAPSLLEVLFAARWADLNAKDLGKPEEAKHFERYTKAFTDLTLGEKRLTWTTKGDLVVELKSGPQHELQGLSSGERQALLLLAELRRYWKPGSMILIDELELHLHDAWQGKLYDVIKSMQVELGGQVIITTQSHSLFEMADLGTRALLGRGSLR